MFALVCKYAQHTAASFGVLTEWMVMASLIIKSIIWLVSQMMSYANGSFQLLNKLHSPFALLVFFAISAIELPSIAYSVFQTKSPLHHSLPHLESTTDGLSDRTWNQIIAVLIEYS